MSVGHASPNDWGGCAGGLELEEKLDVLMFLLAGIWRLLVQIALILIFGFNAVIALLIAINFNLAWLGASATVAVIGPV